MLNTDKEFFKIDKLKDKIFSLFLNNEDITEVKQITLQDKSFCWAIKTGKQSYFLKVDFEAKNSVLDIDKEIVRRQAILNIFNDKKTDFIPINYRSKKGNFIEKINDSSFPDFLQNTTVTCSELLYAKHFSINNDPSICGETELKFKKYYIKYYLKKDVGEFFKKLAQLHKLVTDIEELKKIKPYKRYKIHSFKSIYTKLELIGIDIKSNNIKNQLKDTFPNLDNDIIDYLSILLFKYRKMEKEIKTTYLLPETISHNDFHPLNLMKKTTGETYLIDFDRSGRNKRILDLSSVLVINNPNREFIKKMFYNYSIVEKIFLEEKELDMIYNIQKILELQNVIKLIIDKKIQNTSIDYVKKTYNKIENITEIEKTVNIKEIYNEVIKKNIDKLDKQKLYLINHK